MPTRVLVELRPLRRQSQGDDGPAMQAVLLGLIGDRHPLLAEALHQPGASSRPYSLTTTRKQGNTVRLEFGFLDDSIVPAVIEALDGINELSTHRGARRYRVERGDVYGISYDEMCSDAPESRTWNVDILSPFMARVPIPHSRPRQHVLPDPMIFLPRLERRFEQYTSVSLAEPTEEWIDRVVVSRITELRTKTHLVKTRPQPVHVPGSVGSFRLQMLRHSPTELQSWGALMQFANFAGIGDKTTVGMGHVRCSPFRLPQRSTPPRRRPTNHRSEWV